MHSEVMEDAHWLREVERGNAPAIPVHILRAFEAQGLVCADGILTVLTAAGRYRLNLVRHRMPPVPPARRRSAIDRAR